MNVNNTGIFLITITIISFCMTAYIRAYLKFFLSLKKPKEGKVKIYLKAIRPYIIVTLILLTNLIGGFILCYTDYGSILYIRPKLIPSNFIENEATIYFLDLIDAKHSIGNCCIVFLMISFSAIIVMLTYINPILAILFTIYVIKSIVLIPVKLLASEVCLWDLKFLQIERIITMREKEEAFNKMGELILQEFYEARGGGYNAIFERGLVVVILRLLKFRTVRSAVEPLNDWDSINELFMEHYGTTLALVALVNSSANAVVGPIGPVAIGVSIYTMLCSLYFVSTFLGTLGNLVWLPFDAVEFILSSILLGGTVQEEQNIEEVDTSEIPIDIKEAIKEDATLVYEILNAYKAHLKNSGEEAESWITWSEKIFF